jgi:hypothetical protein
VSSCEEDVTQLNSLIAKSKVTYSTAAGTHMRSVYMLALMGVFFLLYGITSEGLTGFLSVMGVILLIGAGFSYVNAKKYRNEPDPNT